MCIYTTMRVKSGNILLQCHKKHPKNYICTQNQVATDDHGLLVSQGQTENDNNRQHAERHK